MPLILFKCTECGKEKEEIVPMSRVKDGENLFIDCECGYPAIQELAPPAPMQWNCPRNF